MVFTVLLGGKWDIAKDITVERIEESRKLILHIRWQGGANEDIHCNLPPKSYDKYRYREDVVNKVRELGDTCVNREIAKILNQQGLLIAKGKQFSASMISWIRYLYNIPSPVLKKKNELTIKEVAEKFDVRTYMVYYWIERGYIKARKIKVGYPYWITIDSMKAKELRERIKKSYQLKKSGKHS